MTATLTFRKFQPGDEEAILALFERTFGHAIPRDYWEWKYLKNPSGEVYVYLAFDGARCVGQYAMLPMFLSDGEHDVPALAALDNMVHPDYQRMGILKSLENIISAERPDDIPYYTFLNQNSVEVYLKKFGWHHVGDLGVMIKPLSLASAARRKPLLWFGQPLVKLYAAWYARSRPRFQVEPFEAFDDGLDALWRKNRKRLGVTQDRSARIMDWRYNQSPVRYEKFKIMAAGELKGWVIIRIQEKFGATFGWIMDLLLDASVPAGCTGEALLAVENALHGRCDILSMLLPGDAYAGALGRAGFRKIPRRLLPHPFYFCVRRNQSDHPAVMDRENWYFSWSLHDIL